MAEQQLRLRLVEREHVDKARDPPARRRRGYRLVAAAELTNTDLLVRLLGARNGVVCEELTTAYASFREIVAAHPQDLREHGLSTTAVERLSLIAEFASAHTLTLGIILAAVGTSQARLVTSQFQIDSFRALPEHIIGRGQCAAGRKDDFILVWPARNQGFGGGSPESHRTPETDHRTRVWVPKTRSLQDPSKKESTHSGRARTDLLTGPR